MTADLHNILPAIPRHTIFCHITFCPRHPAAKRPARDTTSCHETSHHARFRYVISATFGAKTKRTNFADKYIEQKRMIAQSTQSPIMEIFIAQNVTTCNIFSHRLWITFIVLLKNNTLNSTKITSVHIRRTTTET